MEENLKKAEKFGVAITDDAINKFQIYEKELILWNEKVNLTAIKDPQEIELKHFVDSLSVIQAMPPESTLLIDIGSGAGFPGIPLKIVRPELKVTLVESVKKKTDFLADVMGKLELADIFVVNARAEVLGRDENFRGKFDVATARAVANLATLAEYALPMLKIGGIFIAQKSAVDDEEIKLAEKAISELGGKIKAVIPVEISGLSSRKLVIIEKEKSTPEKYPRRTGVPLKRPLA